MKAEITVPMFTAPKGVAYHSQHIRSAIATIVASKPILMVENLQPVTMATASTHPSPGSGAIFAGMYTNIHNAIMKMLIIKNSADVKIEGSYGMNETR